MLQSWPMRECHLAERVQGEMGKNSEVPWGIAREMYRRRASFWLAPRVPEGAGREPMGRAFGLTWRRLSNRETTGGRP